MMILKNAIKTTGAKTAVDEFIEERNFNKMVYEIIVPDMQYGHLVVLTKNG